MKAMNEFASVLTIGSLILSVCVVTSQLFPTPKAASLVGTAFAESSVGAAALSSDAAAVAEPMQDEPVAANCEQCGVVASMRELRPAEGAVEPRGKPELIKASLQATAVEPTRRYEVTVRMQDGSRRVFVHASPANWRAGERLILIGGTVHASN